MNEEEAIERLNRFKTIKVLYGNTYSMHLEQLEQLQNDIDTVLNLLEKKDKRILDLEYALIDMVMQFADRPKIKDYHYALSTMGLSALETAFAELDFDDPMPVAEAEKKYKVLVDKYYERKVENEN